MQPELFFDEFAALDLQIVATKFNIPANNRTPRLH
jgi:hypothetical protein